MNVMVFLSHHTEPGAMAALAKLRQECAADFDIVPLFDQTRQAVPIEHIPGALGVTVKQVEQALRYPKKRSATVWRSGTFWPQNIELPLLWLFQQKPQYEHYWLMEYDVRFTGHWMELFRHFSASTSDLLATTVFDYSFRPDWDNWRTLASPRPVPNEERVRALLSLCRLSHTALKAVHQAYCDGWSGHYEVTIPTILKTHGLKLEDFGGAGSYVAPGNENRFYRNSPGVTGLAPGTFTVAPNAISQDYPNNMLWHPIKG